MNGRTPTPLAEHPGFVCRREGHVPMLRIMTPLTVASIICPCTRCGKHVEFRSPEVKRV